MLHSTIRAAFGLERLRWVTICSCFLIDFIGLGSVYTFAAISGSIAKGLGRDDVSILGSFMDIGQFCGITMALLFERFGERPTALLAGSFLAGGYFLMGVLLTSDLPIAIYGLLFLMIGQGSVGFASIVSKTAVHIAPPEYRSRMISTHNFSFGLSGLVLAQLFARVFGNDFVAYSRYMTAIAVLLTILIFLLVHDVEKSDDSKEAPVLMMDVGSPDANSNKQSDADSLSVNLLESSGPSSQGASDETFMYIMRSSEFWMLFASFFCIGSCGLSFKNIMGNMSRQMQLSGEIGVDNNLAASIASGWTLSTTISRLIIGFFCDRYVDSIPVCAWSLVSTGFLLASASLLSFISGSEPASTNLLSTFWAAVILNGAGWGVGLSVILSSVAILFGTKSFARNIALMFISVALASYSVVEAVTKFSALGHGLHSFETGLWMIFVFSILSAVPIIWLAYRWKTSFYKLPLNGNSS